MFRSYVQTDLRTDGRTDGQTDGRINERVKGLKAPVSSMTGSEFSDNDNDDDAQRKI